MQKLNVEFFRGYFLNLSSRVDTDNRGNLRVVEYLCETTRVTSADNDQLNRSKWIFCQARLKQAAETLLIEHIDDGGHINILKPKSGPLLVVVVTAMTINN